MEHEAHSIEHVNILAVIQLPKVTSHPQSVIIVHSSFDDK